MTLEVAVLDVRPGSEDAFEAAFKDNPKSLTVEWINFYR